MADLILRTPYTFRDERLFPPGWRSFSTLIYGVNSFELIKEFISLNGINGDVTNEIFSINDFTSLDPFVEYVSVNDLAGTLVTIISRNMFDISSEYLSINDIESPKTLEFILINDLANPNIEIISKLNLNISSEYLSINDIESPKTLEFILINDLANPNIEIISKLNLNISSEYLSINDIESPKTLEFILINDLANPNIEIISKLNLNISSELISINNFDSPVEREYIVINYLSTEKINELIVINDIFENEIATKEISSINILQDAGSFETISHIIHIYIDDTLVDDFVESWQINISNDSYVNSASVKFTDKEMFTVCNPLTSISSKRIKIIIDDIEYNFLLEKREPTRTISESGFSIWGRSLIATLDLPYAVPISDKEVIYDYDTDEWYCPDDPDYVPHIWQIRNCTAKEIMEDIIGDFSLDFQIDDFIVNKGSFSVTHGSPITVVNNLATVVGAHVRTDLVDRVVVRYWQFNTDGTPVFTFTDLENIYMLDEKIEYPGGYNKILVKGYEDPITESSTNIILELDSVLNEDKTRFNFGDDIWIKLYKSPFDTSYDIGCSLGDLYLVASDVQDIIVNESSGFAGKTLSASKPIASITSIYRYNCETLLSSEYSFTSGYNIVTSESSIEDEPVLISYISKYDLYKLIVNKPCTDLVVSEVLSQITAKQT